MSKKLKFYTRMNKTIVSCKNLPSLQEVVFKSGPAFAEAAQNNQLPLQVFVENEALEKMNKDIARASCSLFNSNRIDIFVNQVGELKVIEIRSVDDMDKKAKVI